jgi:alkanesulfonate monooxygenase SsuD/methylene tetrahydromethanopterin reductase-like flavin-dependent oxidoreductase (luciferase family)
MYAVFVEVSAEERHTEAAREYLPRTAATGAREAGAKGGYWLAPAGGRGVSIVVFDTEEEARNLAKRFQVGQPPMSDAPEGVVVKTVEVREVLASV